MAEEKTRELANTLRQCIKFQKTLKTNIQIKKIKLEKIKAERAHMEAVIKDVELKIKQRRKPDKNGQCPAFSELASDGFCYPI